MTTLEPIVEHYARIAAEPDLVIRRAWAEYLKARVPELDEQLPGIREQIRERAQALMQEAAC